MEKKMHVIVAHPGKQHSYRVAEALNGAGILFKYITTVYDRNDSTLMRFVKKIVKKDNQQRADSRKTEQLADHQIVQFCELGGLITLAVLRVDKTKSRAIYNAVNRWVSDIFGKKVAKYAIKNNVDAVVCYDANSFSCFSYLEKHAPQIMRIMDNAAPNRYGLYLEYQSLNRKYRIIDKQPDVFKKYLVDGSKAEYFKEQAELTDKHIVASSFSKRMLTSIGVPEKDIFVVPYGFTRENCEHTYRNSGKLRFLFVGEISAQKGIFDFLYVAEKYGDEAEFHAVGGGIERLQESDQIRIQEHIFYHGYIMQKDLFELYKQADVFVFPSLGDGFGFVVLEALSFGLPVICSKNSIGEDIIKNAYNGFVFDASSNEALSQHVLWFIEHRELISVMRENAIESSHEYSWDQYSKVLCQTIISFQERE